MKLKGLPLMVYTNTYCVSCSGSFSVGVVSKCGIFFRQGIFWEKSMVGAKGKVMVDCD